MPRKKTFQLFREAQKVGSYGELPMLPEEYQIQLRLSRNSCHQPFYALFAPDTMLLLMSGGGSVEFRGSTVRDYQLQPGDCVYVPAGTAHRLRHSEESVVLRYVPQAPIVEGVAWHCPACERELWRKTWCTSTTITQQGYLAAAQTFNETMTLRACPACKCLHPVVDCTSFHWEEVACQALGR